MIVRNI